MRENEGKRGEWENWAILTCLQMHGTHSEALSWRDKRILRTGVGPAVEGPAPATPSSARAQAPTLVRGARPEPSPLRRRGSRFRHTPGGSFS